MQNENLKTAFLRCALAVGFLSAVADRFGMWGANGQPNVAWGDIAHFMHFVGTLNPWLPAALLPAIGWLVTCSEISLGLLLLVGWQTRWAARLSGCLLLMFTIGMTIGLGVKPAFDGSVFAASAGAFMLAAARKYAWSLDDAMTGATDKI
jgi:thiosulfate dehydrogenase (quinone) large subunit